MDYLLAEVYIAHKGIVENRYARFSILSSLVGLLVRVCLSFIVVLVYTFLSLSFD